jgi:hypothetical protein
LAKDIVPTIARKANIIFINFGLEDPPVLYGRVLVLESPFELIFCLFEDETDIYKSRH